MSEAYEGDSKTNLIQSENYFGMGELVISKENNLKFKPTNSVESERPAKRQRYLPKFFFTLL